MSKNPIAIKLTGYFAACLIVFSIIVGGVFMVLFRNHTTQIHKDDLEQRAASIAQTLSGFMSGTTCAGQGGEEGHGGYGAYLRFLDDIAMTDVWIIDKNLDLITRGQGHHMNITYKDLPLDADKVVEEVFAGKTSFSETFSTILNQSTITVGTPIKSKNEIIGVVLLHSPISGINSAIKQGIATLIISITVALALAFLLSLWLSKSFTDPIISKEAAEALRLEKLRRDFVANISHELRTPVAVMRGSLEALVDEVVTEPEQVKNYHKEMLNETLFLQRLVGDLLDLSRLQNADFVIEMQEVTLNDVLEDSIRSLSHIAKEKSVIINFDKSQSPKVLNGDYGRLRQMLLIVLDNAVKFSKNGGTVDVILADNCLSIRDYGAGIPLEDMPYLFDRFYKSRSEQNKSGTGLGLAIAKQIANRHNINLTAENPCGGGARFNFYF